MGEGQPDEIQFYVNNLKRDIEEQTNKFDPKIAKKEGKWQPVSMMDFMNAFEKTMLSFATTNDATITFDLGDMKFQLRVSKELMAQSVDAAMKTKGEDVAKWVPPEEFKKIGEQVYGMLSFMVPTMVQNAKAMQQVGYQYMDLSCSLNNQKYASILPIGEAITYLSSIKAVDMFAQLNQNNSDTPNSNLAPPSDPNPDESK